MLMGLNAFAQSPKLKIVLYPNTDLEYEYAVKLMNDTTFNKDFCFDRKRPLTTLEHLISDYKKNIGENDTTHIEEQKKLHDWSAGGLVNFYELCEINYLTRVVHHHTFNIELVEKMFSYSGFENIVSYIHNFYGTPLNIVNLSMVKNDNY